MLFEVLLKTFVSGAAFSAKDKDQDQWTGNCSKR